MSRAAQTACYTRCGFVVLVYVALSGTGRGADASRAPGQNTSIPTLTQRANTAASALLAALDPEGKVAPAHRADAGNEDDIDEEVCSEIGENQVNSVTRLKASTAGSLKPIPLKLDSFDIRHQTACECNSRQGCGLYAGGGKHAPDTFDSKSYDQMNPEVLTKVDWKPKQGLHASARNLGGTFFANHNKEACKGWLRQTKTFEDPRTACVQHLKHCSMYATIAGASAFQADNTIFHISDSVCPSEENSQLAVTVWFKKDGVNPPSSTRMDGGCMEGFDDMENGRVPGVPGDASKWEKCTADDTWNRYTNTNGTSVFLCKSVTDTKTGTTVRQHECEVRFDPLLGAEQVRLELRCVRKDCTPDDANSGTCCTGVTCVPRAQKMIGLVANGKTKKQDGKDVYDIKPAYGVPMEDAPESVRFQARVQLPDMKVEGPGSRPPCPRSFMQLKTTDLWKKKTVPPLKGSADEKGAKVCETWEFTEPHGRGNTVTVIPEFIRRTKPYYALKPGECSGSDADCLVQNGEGKNDMKVSETFSLQPVCMTPAEGAWAPSEAWCGVSCIFKSHLSYAGSAKPRWPDKLHFKEGEGTFGCNCLSTKEMNKQPPVHPCTSKPEKITNHGVRGSTALDQLGLTKGLTRTRVEYAVSSNEYDPEGRGNLRDNSPNAQRCAGFKPEASFQVHWRFGSKETNFGWDPDVRNSLNCTIQKEIRKQKPILSDAFKKMQDSNKATRDMAASQVGFHICPGVLNNSVVHRHFEQWEVDETLGEFRSDPVVGADAEEISINLTWLPLVQRKWNVTASKRVLLKPREGRLGKWMICMLIGSSSVASEVCCVSKFLDDIPADADHISNMTARSRLKMF